MPTKVVFGIDSLAKIPGIVSNYEPKGIMLITGKNGLKDKGVTDRIVDYLSSYKIDVFNNVVANPTSDIIEDGINFLKNQKSDLIIGLGGGSVIDASKAISKLATNEGTVTQFLLKEREIIAKGLPLIVIPTTAGTGSEVTPYASIINQENKQKISLTHEQLYPDVALVDPTLTVTAPQSITAFGGLDALSHCIESYWSKRRTPMSDLFALEGIKLIVENLVSAVRNPSNLNYREKMSLASLFSGAAISITQTTMVHAVSYPLTARFGIAHGLACSLTLSSFIKYNSKVVRDRIEEIAEKIGLNTAEELEVKVEEVIGELNLPKKLSALNVKESDIDLIVKEGFRPDRAENNPRKVTVEDLRNILESIL